MKKYLLILSCVGASLAAVASVPSTDVKVGDGNVTATQSVTTVGVQELAANTYEMPSADATVSHVNDKSSHSGFDGGKSHRDNVWHPRTNVINGNGGRIHTPIKPNDDAASNLLHSIRSVLSSTPASSAGNTPGMLNKKGGIPAQGMGTGGRKSTDINPIVIGPIRPRPHGGNQGGGFIVREDDNIPSGNNDVTDYGIITIAGTSSDFVASPSSNSGNNNSSLGKRLINGINLSNLSRKFSIDKVSFGDLNNGNPQTLGTGGKEKTGIVPFSVAPGTSIENYRINVIVIQSLLRDSTFNHFATGGFVKVRFGDIELGGGGKKHTEISPLGVAPGTNINTGLFGAKPSIEGVTNLIDVVLTGSSEDVSIEDVTGMIDTLLVK